VTADVRRLRKVQRKLKRFRFTIRTALLVTTAVAVAIGATRFSYYNDRAMAGSIGWTHFQPEGSGVVWSKANAVAFHRWVGPACLESPMRSAGTPWFDRVVSIYILDERECETEALQRATSARWLREVIIDGSVSNRVRNRIEEIAPSSVDCTVWPP